MPLWGANCTALRAATVKQYPDTGYDHQTAQQLPHGKREQHKSDLGVWFAKIFNHKSYKAVSYEIKSQHRARSINFVS